MALIYSSKVYTEAGVPQNANCITEDKTKEWQMELLMEKLRSKAGQFKSFVESAKALRMALLDKRYPCDNVERSQLQKCLDTLQHSIKVTSLQGMVERLESLTRQLGLKFMAGPSGLDWFISSDMFYLEVVLDANGTVQDVKIHHEGKIEIQSCEELVSCLSRGDFADFTAQLEGLASIYQLNAEKKVKCKAFSALQSLEADLSTLSAVQSMIKEPFNLVHKSPVGILEKRRGGHAMKLTYLVSPYDLLDAKTGESINLSLEEVVSRKLGFSALVCMEGSIAHKLPTTPLISIKRDAIGKDSPVYVPLTAANSTSLPACFVLRLSQPLPMCLALINKITQLTELDCADISSPHPLLSLIAQHTSSATLDTRRGLFVSLPDQQHCYFMTETKGLDGVLVTSIPFTHPSHVPQILVFLRQQALLNTLIASCIRPTAKQDLESMTMFEVSALSWQHLSISFEHPLEETLATAELDLADIGNVKCTVHGAGLPAGESVHASKVLQRCLSIPVTMRSLIRSWQTQPSQSASLGSSAPTDPNGSAGDNNDFDISRVKSEPDQTNYSNEVNQAFQPPGDTNFLMSSKGDTKQKVRKRKAAEETSWISPKRKTSNDCEIILESSSEDSVNNVEAEDKQPAILLELEANKGLVPPSVSITPIAFNSVLTGMGLERRPGIEIIPISSSPAAALPSSITITAISGRPVDRKANRTREEKVRLEKRKKRRREEMGIDGLNKPVSVSIKQTDGKGGSGKPSMSTLKCASSPGKDSSKMKTQSSKDKERNKDSVKVKSSIKVKQMDMSEGAALTPGGALPQARNRKGSLSAIVDKLKSAQHLGPEPGEVKPNSTSAKIPGEYMVKPSSDGMKITINKTRTKDKSQMPKSSSSSGSGSPKTHTGLKPGVNSGPASKKPHTGPLRSPSSSSGINKIISKSGSPVSGILGKSNKSCGSPKMGDRRDKTRPLKPGEKGLFVKGKSSPVPDVEGERAFKLLAAHAKIEPSLVVEGLMKSLDTKFQIPKLSARNQLESDPSKKVDKPEVKPIDLVKPELKTTPVKDTAKTTSPVPVTNSLPSVSKPPAVLNLTAKLDEVVPVEDIPVIEEIPEPAFVEPIALPIKIPESQKPAKPDEPRKLLLASEFSGRVNPPIKLPPGPGPGQGHGQGHTQGQGHGQGPGPTTPQEAAEILLDFSAASLKPEAKVVAISLPDRVLMPQQRNTPPPVFPNSPSVTMHIVKSPAPSPLVIPSPHSASPCITDDELMDEALVGMGK